MELRLIEIYLPESEAGNLTEILKRYANLDVRHQKLLDNWLLTRLLLPGADVEKITDELNKRFSGISGFRVLIIGVSATLPQPETGEDKGNIPAPTEESFARQQRISREELYTNLANATVRSRSFIVLMVLSSIVASIGLLQNNLAVIIGAMVIAPLLGPNMALGLATTLGDTKLANRALKTLVLGIIIVLILSIGIGVITKVDSAIPEIASRTQVGMGTVLVALASGSAGALAFTSGLSRALIGVMVSVALLPPLVTLGLLLGSTQWQPAYGALLLGLINIVAINLAAVGTFIFQGIRPASWWEAEKAKNATSLAMVLWIILLAILVALILLSHHSLP